MVNPRSWTDAERRQVGDWLLAGKSLGRIAKLIGATRNVVIGRVSRDGELHAFVGAVVVAHRLGVEPSVMKRRAKRHAPGQVPSVPAHAHHELLACVEVGPQAEPVEPLLPGELPGVALLDLGPRECKWPVAEHPQWRGRHLFCGRPRLGDWTPYCAHHHRRAH
jgi:hypothetical protein